MRDDSTWDTRPIDEARERRLLPPPTSGRRCPTPTLGSWLVPVRSTLTPSSESPGGWPIRLSGPQGRHKRELVHARRRSPRGSGRAQDAVKEATGPEPSRRAGRQTRGRSARLRVATQAESSADSDSCVRDQVRAAQRAIPRARRVGPGGTAREGGCPRILAVGMARPNGIRGLGAVSSVRVRFRR